MEQMSHLPDRYLRLTGADAYPVKISGRLDSLRKELFEEYRREYLA